MEEQNNSGMTMAELMKEYENKEKELYTLSKAAENAEQFANMCSFMKRLLEVKKEKADKMGEKVILDELERNSLSIAYKNVVSHGRGSWRAVDTDLKSLTEDASRGFSVSKKLGAAYKKHIENELEKWCREVLDLIKNILLASDADIESMKKKSEDMTAEEKLKFPDVDKESTIFYLKMCGDYYRYLAEFMDTPEVKNNAQDNYDKALEVAKVCLPSTHPTRLGLVLNASVCKYEIMKQHAAARTLAKEGFDSAIQKLDSLQDSTYKDSTLIMQLLRDNLTIWTSSDDDNQEDRED